MGTRFLVPWQALLWRGVCKAIVPQDGRRRFDSAGASGVYFVCEPAAVVRQEGVAMTLAELWVDFVPLRTLTLTAELLAHGLHRLATSRRELWL